MHQALDLPTAQLTGKSELQDLLTSLQNRGSADATRICCGVISSAASRAACTLAGTGLCEATCFNRLPSSSSLHGLSSSSMPCLAFPLARQTLAVLFCEATVAVCMCTGSMSVSICVQLACTSWLPALHTGACSPLPDCWMSCQQSMPHDPLTYEATFAGRACLQPPALLMDKAALMWACL